MAVTGASELKAASPGRYRELLQGPFQAAVLEVINADLPRTFPDNIHFRGEASAARTSLGNVLRAFSKHRPNVGYCQVRRRGVVGTVDAGKLWVRRERGGGGGCGVEQDVLLTRRPRLSRRPV